MLHLVHPALVHFGIAFVAVGGLLEAWGMLRDDEQARRWGTPMLVGGTLTLVAVIASGYVAANTIELAEAARPTLKTHERNGWMLLAGLVLLQFWKAWGGGELPPLQRRLYGLLLVVMVGWMAWSAWLGGKLVYTFGTGVSPGGTTP